MKKRMPGQPEDRLPNASDETTGRRTPSVGTVHAHKVITYSWLLYWVE